MHYNQLWELSKTQKNFAKMVNVCKTAILEIRISGDNQNNIASLKKY